MFEGWDELGIHDPGLEFEKPNIRWVQTSFRTYDGIIWLYVASEGVGLWEALEGLKYEMLDRNNNPFLFRNKEEAIRWLKDNIDRKGHISLN